MFKVSNLNLYLNKSKILKNLSFNINPQTINIIMGQNGAGKTSLIKCLASIYDYEGKIEYNSNNLKSLSLDLKAKEIGYLAQNTKPQWNIKAFDLIALGRLKSSTNLMPIDIEIIEATIKNIGIEKLKDKNIFDLSGGELALCLLARVICTEPKLIILDEPLNHLDIKYQRQIIRILKEYKANGGTIILIIHDINIAYELGEYYIFMKNGEILKSGDKAIFTKETLTQAYEIEFYQSNESFGALP